MSDKRQFQPGDAVEWASSQGPVSGTVRKRLTAPMEIKGYHVAAGPDHPQYLVESKKTGAPAAHKPDALKVKQKKRRPPRA